MSDKCDCEKHGFCNRRGCVIPKIHWKRCQAGQCDLIDRLYSGLAEAKIQKASNPDHQAHEVPVTNIGTRLKNIIQRETGTRIPCSACSAEINRLNNRTVEYVLDNINEIADGIIQRGQTVTPKWWQRWGAKYAPGICRIVVRNWIREACEIPEREQQ